MIKLPTFKVKFREVYGKTRYRAVHINVHYNVQSTFSKTHKVIITNSLSACGARFLGFDTRSHRYDLRDRLSPASNHDMTEISLKGRKSAKQPTNSIGTAKHFIQCKMHHNSVFIYTHRVFLLFSNIRLQHTFVAFP